MLKPSKFLPEKNASFLLSSQTTRDSSSVVVMVHFANNVIPAESRFCFRGTITIEFTLTSE